MSDSDLYPAQDGNLVPFAKSDCIQCRPDQFCDQHWTRENTRPRARDCARCKEERGERGWSRRKNMCSHHKPDCVDEVCLGCLRKDRCLACSACQHGILRMCCVECKPAPRGYPSAPPKSPSLSSDEESV